MTIEGLAAALGIDGPAEALGRLERLYAEVDAELAASSRGLDLPCRRGCSDCCYEAVFVSGLEFLLVARTLLGWPEARRSAVVGSMRALARRFADELELLEAIEPGPERDEVAARIRFRCPLLDEAESCAIHPVRELNARSFGQTWDARRHHPFGCERTHARLEVLGQPSLPDARALRVRLAALPGTERVHVYPWWFERYGAYLDPGPEHPR